MFSSKMFAHNAFWRLDGIRSPGVSGLRHSESERQVVVPFHLRTYGWNRHSDPQRLKTFLVFQGIFYLNLLLAQIMKASQRLIVSRRP